MSAASGAEMTPRVLQQICRSLSLYQTAELNDKLYLHYKGFTRIAHLEPYTQLKVLYLEGNALSSLQGLEAQQQLRALYVQENSLEAIDSLCALPQLSTLNASTNFIAALPSEWQLVDRLPALHSLTLQSNRFASVESLSSLRAHPQLAVLDLQHNRLGSLVDASLSAEQQAAAAELDFAALLSLLGSLPQLRVLYLLGNALLARLPSYRKRTLAALPQLTYLDERPVGDEERRMVTAWQRGGLEAEREEKGRMRAEERAKERRQWELFDKLVNDAASSSEAKEHDALAKEAKQRSRQQDAPVVANTGSGGGASSGASSVWDEKECLTASAEDELVLDEGQRVGRASGAQSAVQAWPMNALLSKQKQSAPSAAKLELSPGGPGKRHGGGMLIEVIDDEIDA